VRCFLLVGKESSGSRLLSRVFENSGCWAGAKDDLHADYHLRAWIGSGTAGADSFMAFLNRFEFRMAPQNIVYRTHPSPNYHPHLSVVVDKLRDVGYEIWWIVLLRRPQRWLKLTPACDPNEIWYHFRNIFRLALDEEQIAFWDNSLCFLDPERYLSEMSRLLGLELKSPELIWDADKRWIE